MFSGIVSEIASVLRVEEQPQGRKLFIRASLFADAADPVQIGESISLSGVCLTLTSVSNKDASFDVASETLRCTTLGQLAAGASVNLERALSLGDKLGGHFVVGHVDAVSGVKSMREEGDTLRLEISLPAHLAELVVPKGSITIDGTSLTVGEVLQDSFLVYIIPFTKAHTICGSYRAGTPVNIETDYIARYLRQLAQPYRSPK